MVHHHQLAAAFLLGLAATLVATPAAAVTLEYKQANKWVAPEDNKPLQKLMEAARGGQTHFTVSLPQQNRALATTRLLIIRDILAREADKPVILEESSTTSSKPNTLTIR